MAGNNSKRSRRRRGGKNKKKMENGESAEGSGGASGGTSQVESTANSVEGAVGGAEGQNSKDENKQSSQAKGAEGGTPVDKRDFLSDEMKAKIQEASERAMRAIQDLRKTQENLTDYQEQLQQWMAEQEILENRLLEAIEGTRNMRARITAEEERVAALKQNLEVMQPEEESEGRQV